MRGESPLAAHDHPERRTAAPRLEPRAHPAPAERFSELSARTSVRRRGNGRDQRTATERGSGRQLPPTDRRQPMDTRTIAIAALVIAVILVLVIFVI